MLKFLLPFLLVSSFAFPAELPKERGVVFSSPYTVKGPAETVVTRNMNVGKCTTGSSMLDELHEAGFQGLVQFVDGTNPKIVRVTMFDKVSNEMAMISMVYATPVADGVKKENIKKICVEYVGNNPYARGDTFKDFVIQQDIDWNNIQLDGAQEQEKARREKQGEPYQGDQNHS